MRTQQGSLAWIGFAGILLGVVLIVMQARFLGAPILDFEFHVPQDPWALVGNSLITLSILFLVWLKLKLSAVDEFESEQRSEKSLASPGILFAILERTAHLCAESTSVFSY